MDVGCILYRNCISRPAKVDTLGGLVFVCDAGSVYLMQKRWEDTGDMEGKRLSADFAVAVTSGCGFVKFTGKRQSVGCRVNGKNACSR